MALLSNLELSDYKESISSITENVPDLNEALNGFSWASQEAKEEGESDKFMYPSHTSDINASGYEWITSLILKHKPQVSSSINGKGQPVIGPFTSYKKGSPARQSFTLDPPAEDGFRFSRSYLGEDLLTLTEEQTQLLTESHSAFVREIENIKRENKHNFFGKDGDFTETNTSGDNKQGIVFVGGGKFSFLTIQIVEQLRHNNNTLPIEIFIGSKDEYDSVFCEDVVGKFQDVRCVVFEDEFGGLSPTEVFYPDQSATESEGELLQVEISGFQYKMLALMVSRFEDVLLLDADNSPLFDVEPLFQSKVYKEKGLVVWPDPWARTTHPSFYDIAGVQISNQIVRGYDYNVELPLDFDYDTQATFHDLNGTLPNPTAESGMMLVSKTRHLKTLLLSLYYNIYGPGLYYSLLTQGGAGEGDKETFLASAFVLGEPYHQVQSMFDFIGYVNEEGSFNAKALGQKDPQADYQNYQLGVRFNVKESTISDSDRGNSFSEPKVWFMHLSYPKFTPQLLMDNAELTYVDSQDVEQHRRLYGGVTDRAGYDFELRIFRILNGIMCDTKSAQRDHSMVLYPDFAKDLKIFKDVDLSGYCQKLGEHVDWLRENS
ncbi:hypothetical protein WICPIJ_001862 [Wickerhamomyces pijperi]|uniref:Glycosyltransferase family 71 protein n=1 Tax=Wickerhamomyces pijperi TaxID=599730 RepID=A0A9P8QCP7_WICPI|nr:hypothetical protein WICPIJ_001862 [Wickerhamomyces pijperi]